MSCQAGPRQGQAEQLSKSRKKFHATTYKPLFLPLYSFTQFRPQHCVLSGFVASPCLGRGAADDVAVSAAAAAASVRTDPFNQIRLGETPAAFARDRVRCSLGRRGRPPPSCMLYLAFWSNFPPCFCRTSGNFPLSVQVWLMHKGLVIHVIYNRINVRPC